MSEEIKKLEQANQKMEMNGTVSEFDVTIKECKKKCNIDGEEKEIKSAMIYGKVVADVNGDSMDFSLSALYLGKHNKNGDENKAFKGMMTNFGYDYHYDESKGRVVYEKVSDGLIPKIQGKVTFKYLDNTKEEFVVKNDGREPSRINGSGVMGLKEGLNKDQSDLAFYKELILKYISTQNVGEDKCSYFIEGYVKDIVDEMNSNGGMTGRLLVNLVVPTFFGVDVYDGQFTVPSEWEVIEENGNTYTVTANDFKAFLKEVGRSVKLMGDVDVRQVGTTQQASAHHFGASSNVSSGYKVQDWNVKGGDALEKPYEKELINKALEEHSIVLDTNYAKRKKDYEEAMAKKNNSNNSNTNKGLRGNSGFGSKSSVSTSTIIEEDVLPF